MSPQTSEIKLMANILHEFTVKAEASRIFECVSTPAGLDQWWTHSSSGRPLPGAVYALGLGPEYDWEARVSRCAKDAEFELEMTEAADEWQDTRIGFRLLPLGDHTQVSFWHTGWKEETHHFGATAYSWAMHLRVLKRYLEQGDVIPYEQRLEA